MKRSDVGAQRQRVYAYEVMPVNFAMLPEKRQGELIDVFHRLLNSLSGRVRVTVARSRRTVKVGDQILETTHHRFFMEGFGEPLDYLLDSHNFSYQRVTEVPKVEVVKVFPKWLALADGALMKTFSLCGLPGRIVEGFLSETYGVAERVTIDVRPLPPEAATAKMSRYVKFLKSVILADEAKGKSADQEKVLRYRMAEEALDSLITGQTRLLEARVNVSVTGRNKAELLKNARMLRETLQSRLVKLDSPAYVQYPMAVSEDGKRLILDTVTAGAFFPFAAADVIEVPDGIFLGVNKLTGAPVIFDPYLRANFNLAVIGVSGSGKSFASKMMLTRLAEKNRDMAFYVVDPENEYGRIGALLDAKVVDVRPGEELGLDPLTVFPKLDAADMAAALAKVPVELQSTLRTVVYRSSTLAEAYEDSPPELRRYLESLVHGPESFIFAGEPMSFTNRMVFSLRGLESEFLKQALSLLLFGKIWAYLNDEAVMPRELEKLVLVDEAWLYMAVPPAAKFLERVSRMGRKRNILFAINTQRAMDVLGEASGRAVLENCATKILLRQDEAAVNLVADAFGLSEAEKAAVVEFKPGQGILVAENIHVPLEFIASKEEYALFTTKPSEAL